MIEEIQNLVCAEERIPNRATLSSASRKATLVAARGLGMYLTKELTVYSTVVIGKNFGGRDHSTVAYAINKVEGKIAASPDYKAYVERLKAKLRG